ncbi:MAG: nitrogenase component 1 [Lachnospiraceae bacterium]|nr:nitrogenase component 1 [Lachnospiraceae bacterium]
MRQTTGLTSTYSSDEFGICSALYELGGMVVMHDASGCNSTYTTHDEPRWYDMDSMIFISAISEAEAIMGDDDKFIDDLIETAGELHPKFIALVGAPIPYMIGTDLDAIARIVSGKTGLPCFTFAANGMHDYTRGVSMAMERIVREFAEEENSSARLVARPVDKVLTGSRTVEKVGEDTYLQSKQMSRITVNILGATPLDFSLNGSMDSMKEWVTVHGMELGLCLSMGCTLEDIRKAGEAQVNLVISAGGLAAAKYLRGRFGTPYVVGVPIGEAFSENLSAVVRTASRSADNIISYLQYGVVRQENRMSIENKGLSAIICCAIIGEAVYSASLAATIEMEYGIRAEVLCPLDVGQELLRPEDHYVPEEDDLICLLKNYDAVIADPLYRPLLRGEKQKFYPLPHEAFSGRIYDSVNPNLIVKRLNKAEIFR